MRYLVLLGRICFSAIFILSSVNQFNGTSLAYAARAGVPASPILVPLSGALILLGGLSIFLGYRARLGAWLIVLFLVPVTLVMHRFWGLPDPRAAMEQQINFMKNVSMLGGALLIAYFGAGPFSLDARRGRLQQLRGRTAPPALRETPVPVGSGMR